MAHRRYRGRHLRPRPRRRGPVVIGSAAAVWLAGPAAKAAAVHEVQPGETLSQIAARYDTSPGALARANDLADVDLIISGQRLRVPGPSRPVASVHVVEAGDTLAAIADRYDTTVQRLARMNDIPDVNLIVIGARLRVPGAAPAPAAPAPAPASRASIEATIEHQASSHGIDPSLAKAVAWVESGWRQDVVSHAGAVGVMQVMPDTADYVNRSLHGGALKLRRAEDNVHLGVMYLDHMVDSMGSEHRALAAYYSGPGNVGTRLKGYQRWYVRMVEGVKRRF